MSTPENHEAVEAGAGPAGLAAAALLNKRGFEVLVLERADAVGARWRKRYEPLRLNTARFFSSLPGYRIPPRYGRYARREDFVAYLEFSGFWGSNAGQIRLMPIHARRIARAAARDRAKNRSAGRTGSLQAAGQLATP